MSFGLCYNCKDGQHDQCIGVPCECPCPVPPKPGGDQILCDYCHKVKGKHVMVVQPATEFPVFVVVLCQDCWVGHGGKPEETVFVLKLVDSPFATALTVDGKLDLPLKDAIRYCRGQKSRGPQIV